jgi:hypothetical protein
MVCNGKAAKGIERPEPAAIAKTAAECRDGKERESGAS